MGFDGAWIDALDVREFIDLMGHGLHTWFWFLMGCVQDYFAGIS